MTFGLVDFWTYWHRTHYLSCTSPVSVFEFASSKKKNCHHMEMTDIQLNPGNIKVANTTYSSNNFENIVLRVSLNIKCRKHVTSTEWQEILTVTSCVVLCYLFNEFCVAIFCELLLRHFNISDAQTSAWQHTTLTTDIHATCGIRALNSNKRGAA
jgi:hypothetical protein